MSSHQRSETRVKHHLPIPSALGQFEPSWSLTTRGYLVPVPGYDSLVSLRRGRQASARSRSSTFSDTIIASRAK